MDIDLLEEEDSLFKNEEALDYSFLPDKLPHRESEIEEIASCIRPLVHKRKPTNLLIFGKHGIGKTASVRFLFKQLENLDIKTCFINCWEYQTSYAILSRVSQLLGLPLPRKGKPTDSLLEDIKNKLDRQRGIVIALDEIDKLEGKDFLYQLSEKFSSKICMLLITNNKEYVLNIEPRTRSRLSLESFEYKPYTKKQVYDILLERKKIALRVSIMDDSIFNMAVEECHKNEDIRTGLFLLLKSVRIAENRASKTIAKKDMQLAIDKVVSEFTLKKDIKLNPEEEKIINCIKKQPGKVSGDLFTVYKKSGGLLGERSYRKYINRLMQLNLIESRETKTGLKGKSRELHVRENN